MSLLFGRQTSLFKIRSIAMEFPQGLQLSFSQLDVITLLARNSYTLLINRLNSNYNTFSVINSFTPALDVHRAAPFIFNFW